MDSNGHRAVATKELVEPAQARIGQGPTTAPRRRRREAADPALGPPLLLRVSEAAQLLHLSETTVWALVANGQLRSLKIGKARRIPADAVAQLAAREGEIPVDPDC